jgi:hypothetical protein
VAGFALVDFGAPAPVDDPAGDANRRVAGRLAELLSGHLGHAHEEERLRTILVCVEAADAVLGLAFRSDPAGDPAIVAETRILLRAYLARLLD